jgi:Phosphatidylinositol transfer protein.
MIRTKFEDNNGSNDNCLGLTEEELLARQVEYLDIAYDEINPKHYKEEEVSWLHHNLQSP